MKELFILELIHVVLQGIYKAEFDTETGQAKSRTFACPTLPFVLTSTKYLYTVEAKTIRGGNCSLSNRSRTRVKSSLLKKEPHYVAVDEKRDLVYGANYHKGQVLVYKRQEDGSLLLSDMDQHSGPHGKSSFPHVHTDLTPTTI